MTGNGYKAGKDLVPIEARKGSRLLDYVVKNKSGGGEASSAAKDDDDLALPKILQLHLQRFKWDPSLRSASKDLSPLSFSETLPLSIADGTLTSRSVLLDDDVSGALPSATKKTPLAVKYDLQSVVVHRGTSLEKGHYYCYVRLREKVGDGGHEWRWYRFDDEVVEGPVGFERVLEDGVGGGKKEAKCAYLLQYVRRDAIAELYEE